MLPAQTPADEIINVIIPIIAAAINVLIYTEIPEIILTGTHTKVIPTASASMLVAIAIISIVLNPSESSASFSSENRASLIILPPIAKSRTNAIPMVKLNYIRSKPYSCKVTYNRHHSLKCPKPYSTYRRLYAYLCSFIARPLHIDTANASIARPIDNITSSNRLI